MVQFLLIIFFFGFLQFLLGFSKVPVFLCHPVQEIHPNLCRAEILALLCRNSVISITLDPRDGGYLSATN